jgi:hypothetical protein
LKAFINGQPPYTEALSPVRVTPVPATAPELWMFASSEDGRGLLPTSAYRCRSRIHQSARG